MRYDASNKPSCLHLILVVGYKKCIPYSFDVLNYSPDFNLLEQELIFALRCIQGTRVLKPLAIVLYRRLSRVQTGAKQTNDFKKLYWNFVSVLNRDVSIMIWTANCQHCSS